MFRVIKVLSWLSSHASVPTEKNTGNSFLEQRPYLLLKHFKWKVIIGNVGSANDWVQTEIFFVTADINVPQSLHV